jgi:hypothetical protein
MFGSNLSFGLFSLGWLLLGEVLRTYTYPRGAVVLLMVGSCVLPFSLHRHSFRLGGGLNGLELVVGEGRIGRATRTRAMRVDH